MDRVPRIARASPDVEDAFQATFFILAERAGSIRTSDSAAAWLYKVAQRTSLAVRRKRSQRREQELEDDSPDGVTPLPLGDQQLVFVLMEELRSLPERYQVPLVMRYLEGHSRRTIAEQTDSTLAQIQGRLVRGRRLLRSRMVRRGMSLSLAAGAVTVASASARAAVSPALATTTAKACLAFKTSGTVGGAAATALELAHQGAKAMWLATFMKTTAAVSGLFVAAGIAWGVQGGKRDTGDGSSAARTRGWASGGLTAVREGDANRDARDSWYGRGSQGAQPCRRSGASDRADRGFKILSTRAPKPNWPSKSSEKVRCEASWSSPNWQRRWCESSKRLTSW